MKEKTKQSKKIIKQESRKEPHLRISLFGLSYSDSTHDDWRIVDGVGWIHKYESGRFDAMYGYCYVSKSICLKKEMANIRYQGMFLGIAKKAILDKPDSGYFYDFYTEAYHPNDDGVKALSSRDYETVVSRETIRHHFTMCELSNAWVHNNSITSVMQLDGTTINANMSMSLSDNAPFLPCRRCGCYFVAALLTTHHSVDGFLDRMICGKCIEVHSRKVSIRKHDYKGYPDPMYTREFNYIRGERIERPSYRLFGVEVETELDRDMIIRDDIDRFDIAMDIAKYMPNGFMIIKEDGSLTMNGKYTNSAEFDQGGKVNGCISAGFEMVSAPADINAHRACWPVLASLDVFKYLRAWNTPTCGMHVHVSREAMSNLQIGRIIAFINHPVNVNFMRKISGRSSGQYCRRENKKLSDALRPERGDRDIRRRVAVNVQNNATIEFRMFRGTIKPYHIIRNIEFVDAVCDYCSPSGRSLRDMFSPESFVMFCLLQKKRWPILVNWIFDSGLSFRPIVRKDPRAKPKPIYECESDDRVLSGRSVKSDWDAVGLSINGVRRTDSRNITDSQQDKF
jgi:hypothetical protein